MDLKKVVNIDDNWIGGGFDGRFIESCSESEDKNCNCGLWVLIV